MHPKHTEKMVAKQTVPDSSSVALKQAGPDSSSVALKQAGPDSLSVAKLDLLFATIYSSRPLSPECCAFHGGQKQA